ncbi:MAG: hypothetical protein Q9216_001450, partial [Gyalolechia sp. 2 TL-2023]
GFGRLSTNRRGLPRLQKLWSGPSELISQENVFDMPMMHDSGENSWEPEGLNPEVNQQTRP